MAINKIKSTSIEDDAITSAKVADGVISAADVADGTLTSAKLSYPLTTFSSTGIDDNATSTAITIDSSQNVGIGTTSPNTLLHLKSNNAEILFEDSNPDDTREAKIHTNAGDLIFQVGDDLTGTPTVDGQLTMFDGGSLIYSQSGTNRFNINTSGYVGIGESSPSVILQIAGEGTSGANNIINTWSADSSGYSPAVTLRKTRGTKASPTVVQSGDQAGVLVFSGYDGTNHINTATIESRVDGTPGTNDMPGRLGFSVTPDGGSSPSERMRIHSNGAISYDNTGQQKYEAAGFTGINGAGNRDFLLSTDFGTNDAIYVEWSYAWNAGDGGTFGVGYIWYEQVNSTVRFRKIAESTNNPMSSSSAYLSGSNLYLRLTSSTGINGYYNIKIRTQGCTANAFS